MAEISNKTTALNNAVSQIEKQFGKGSIMKLGGKEVVQIPAISSGCIALDIISGIGGFPRGRVIEIYGPEGSGKTTLALHAIAEAQKAGGYAAFIDAEHALDPLYAQKLGVNIDELYIAQPDWGEQALEIAEILVRSGGVDIIVVDSVAALVPKAELEGDMGDSHMGLQARLMSQALRKLTAIVARSKTTFVFLNQLREKIGMFVGNPEVTTGGRALKFYASMRIEVKRTMAIKEGTDIVGGRVQDQDRQEQDGAALQGGRGRPVLRQGLFQGERHHRARRPLRDHQQDRRLVLLQRQPPGPGQGGGAQAVRGEPRPVR